MAGKKLLGNDYIIEGSVTKIIVHKLDGSVHEILIDTEDLNKVVKYLWSASYTKRIDNYYATTSMFQGEGIKNKTVYMHRIIMDANKKDYVDHIESGKTLDNRKTNLRKTNNARNSANRKGANKNNNTGYRNVNWIESTNEYWVQIMKDGVRYKWIFNADQLEEAVKFAEEKRIELFGEFAGKG